LQENRAVFEIIWKNMVQPARQAADGSAIECTRIACWPPKAKNTHSEYVKIIALPNQKLLRESASMLLSKYITCFPNFYFS
jgi:hypothetical protein